MQISSFISDSYIINLCLGYQLCLICPLILLYFSTFLHRNPGIFSPYVWTLPSKSYLPFCLKQEYSYLCGQGGDVTMCFTINHPNYARYIVHCFLNLVNIDDTHPRLRQVLENGSLSIRSSAKSFAKKAVDMTLEQTITADASSQLAGISAFSQSFLHAATGWFQKP